MTDDQSGKEARVIGAQIFRNLLKYYNSRVFNQVIKIQTSDPFWTAFETTLAKCTYTAFVLALLGMQY